MFERQKYLSAGFIRVGFRGHAISRNGTEPMRNIPQDAKTRNGYFKAYNGQIYA